MCMKNALNITVKSSYNLKQVSSLSSGASIDKPIQNTTRRDSVEDPIESEANSSALVAGTTGTQFNKKYLEIEVLPQISIRFYFEYVTCLNKPL